MKISAIIPAAGSGSRFSNVKNKLLENICGMPVIVHTLKIIASIEEIDEIIICSSEDLIPEIQRLIDLYSISKVKNVIQGGKTRQESVFIGLKSLKDTPDLVVIHDGARPLISREIVQSTINTAKEKGAAIVAVPTKDTIKKVDKAGQIIETIDRSQLWNVQTPQIFKYNDILSAHSQFHDEDFTDDSAMIEKLGIAVTVVQGSYKNIKITTEEDLLVAEAISKKL